LQGSLLFNQQITGGPLRAARLFFAPFQHAWIRLQLLFNYTFNFRNLNEVVTQKNTRKSFLLIKELGAIQRCQNWVIQLKKQSRLAKFYEELTTLEATQCVSFAFGWRISRASFLAWHVSAFLLLDRR
jgi:hypothetical protein